MGDDQIFLNYTLTGDPVFNKDYMTVPFDGTFMHTINPNPEDIKTAV